MTKHNGIDKKLPNLDLGDCATAIKIDNYLDVNCGLVAADKFGGIVVFNDGTEYHYDCGAYERCLNIELTWQHDFTLGKILEYVNVNEGYGKCFCNVNIWICRKYISSCNTRIYVSRW